MYKVAKETINTMSEEIKTGRVLSLDLEFAFLAGRKPGIGHAQLGCSDPCTGGWVFI